MLIPNNPIYLIVKSYRVAPSSTSVKTNEHCQKNLKMITSQLSLSIHKINLLQKHQPGFRRAYNCLFMRCTRRYTNKFDSVVTLDRTKAIDIINHKIFK